MCQPRPGLRCPSDTRKVLDSCLHRLRIAERQGNEAQIALMRSNLRRAKVDYYSTPEGQQAAAAECQRLRVLELSHDGAAFTSTSGVDEHGQVWQVVTNSDGVPVQVTGHAPAELTTGLSKQPLPRGLWGPLSAQLGEVDAERALASEGWALRAAHRDQVALMPADPGADASGHAQYQQLAEARDELASAEARFAVAVMTGSADLDYARIRLENADHQVHQADQQYRLATGQVRPETALEALKPAVATLALRDDARSPDRALRDRALRIIADFETDRAWATFGRPDYRDEVEDRPAAPWVRAQRALTPADIARVYLHTGLVPRAEHNDGTTALVLQVPGRSSEHAQIVKKLWAAGYWTDGLAGSYDRAGRCRIERGPDLPAWAATRDGKKQRRTA